MDDWVKLIGGVLVLVIWALNSVFNREEPKPAPAGRPPLGPRPGGLPPAPRPADRATTASPTMRWPGPAEAPPPRRPTPDVPPDAEVFVLGAEPTRPPRPATGPGPRSTRRSGRGQSTPSGGPEPGKISTLTTGVVQSVAQNLGQTMDLKPLTMSPAASTSTTPAPSPASALRDVLRSPNRLREAFLLNEILQPPPALRRSRRV